MIILFCRWWEIVFGNFPLCIGLPRPLCRAMPWKHLHLITYTIHLITRSFKLEENMLIIVYVQNFQKLLKRKPIVQFLVIVIFSKPSSSFYTSNKLGWLKFKFWCNSWTHNILSFLLQVPLFSSPKLYPVIFLSPIKKWGQGLKKNLEF